MDFRKNIRNERHKWNRTYHAVEMIIFVKYSIIEN